MPPIDPTLPTASTASAAASSTPASAPVSAASTNPGATAPGSATIPPPAAGAPTTAPVPASPVPVIATAPAPAPAKPAEKFILIIDGTENPDPALVARAIELAKAAGFKPVHYAYAAHDSMEVYGRLFGLTGEHGETAILMPVNALNDERARREFPVAELFDPKTAETAYAQLVEAAKKAAEPAPSTPAAPLAAKVALILALLLPTLFGLSGCGTTTGVAQKPSTAQTTAAKIGTIVKAIETPTIVQGEAQLVTAEILQRAVAENKQAVVAGWCSCIARGLEDLAGSANPSAADLEAAIKLEAGPQTDPAFDVLIATAVDTWSTVKAAIPPGSTAAQVETYLNAAATGVQNAAVGYLSAPAKITAWITLERAHQRALRRVARVERRVKQ